MDSLGSVRPSRVATVVGQGCTALVCTGGDGTWVGMDGAWVGKGLEAGTWLNPCRWWAGMTWCCHGLQTSAMRAAGAGALAGGLRVVGPGGGD